MFLWKVDGIAFIHPFQEDGAVIHSAHSCFEI